MKKILLGVTSGVAIYKACELVRSFKKEGCDVKVIMTPSASKLISPYLFETLSCNPVYVDMFDRTADYTVEHISLAQWADVILVAPCTLATLSKIATGVCDNLLTTVFMALPVNTPKFIAPAMNSNMWNNPITQKNILTLKDILDIKIIEPQSGELACGDEGIGKLADLEIILNSILE